MSLADEQFAEDRALRDAAKAVLLADIEHAKAALSGKAIAGRVGGRVGDGAKDAFEIAKGHADDNRGLLAIIIGALILWFAKQPILELLGLSSSPEKDESDIDPEDTTGEEYSDDIAPPVDEAHNLETTADGPDVAASTMVNNNE